MDIIYRAVGESPAKFLRCYEEDLCWKSILGGVLLAQDIEVRVDPGHY